MLYEVGYMENGREYCCRSVYINLYSNIVMLLQYYSSVDKMEVLAEVASLLVGLPYQALSLFLNIWVIPSIVGILVGVQIVKGLYTKKVGRVVPRFTVPCYPLNAALQRGQG